MFFYALYANVYRTELLLQYESIKMKTCREFDLLGKILNPKLLPMTLPSPGEFSISMSTVDIAAEQLAPCISASAVGL